MPTLFDPAARDSILARVTRLAPDRKALWGRFTAPHMVCHLTLALQQSLGELETGPPVGPFRHPPINWLVIHVVPWPKGGAQSPPEFLVTRPTTWDSDMSRLVELIGRVSKRGPNAAWPTSRTFGRISGRTWGVLHHKHLDHHLRQFAV